MAQPVGTRDGPRSSDKGKNRSTCLMYFTVPSLAARKCRRITPPHDRHIRDTRPTCYRCLQNRAMSQLRSIFPRYTTEGRASIHGATKITKESAGRTAATLGDGQFPELTVGVGMFKTFMDTQLDAFKQDPSFKRINIPSTLSSGVGLYRKKTCICQNRLYKSSRIRKMRITCVEAGEELQIYNSCVYPQTWYDIPILGIDLLHFGRKTLCFIDFQPLEKENEYLEKYLGQLASIKQQYPHFNNPISKRFYDDTRWFSDEMMYLNDPEHISDFYCGFKLYLESYMTLLYHATPVDSERAQFVAGMHSEYDRYNREKDPAIGMFGKIFGGDFAKSLGDDLLFTY